MDCHGLSWTIMDCHGLIWDNSIYWLVSYWQTYIITRVRTNSSNYSFFRIVAHRIVYSTTVKLQLWEVCLGPELFVVFVHVCDNSISVLSANKSKHLSTPKEYWFSPPDNPRKGNILFISIIRCVLYWICLWICYYSQGYFCRLDVLANVNMFCRNIICEVSFTKNLIIYA